MVLILLDVALPLGYQDLLQLRRINLQGMKEVHFRFFVVGYVLELGECLRRSWRDQRLQASASLVDC